MNNKIYIQGVKMNKKQKQMLLPIIMLYVLSYALLILVFGEFWGTIIAIFAIIIEIILIWVKYKK